MHWTLIRSLCVALSMASCGSPDPASLVGSSGTHTTATPVTEAPASTEPTSAATTTTTVISTASGEGVWTGREVELRRPPGSESVPGQLNDVLQTVVWVDGHESGLWTWDTPGYGIYLVGEGPNPRRAQWEAEATPDAPPPEPVPIEEGTINDLMLWSLTTLEEYPDGSGGSYQISDWQPIRLMETEDFALTTSQCYYKDGRPARLFGWISRADASAGVPESGDPDPIEPWLAFELVSTPEGTRITGVDSHTMRCSP